MEHDYYHTQALDQIRELATINDEASIPDDDINEAEKAAITHFQILLDDIAQEANSLLGELDPAEV